MQSMVSRRKNEGRQHRGRNRGNKGARIRRGKRIDQANTERTGNQNSCRNWIAWGRNRTGGLRRFDQYSSSGIAKVWRLKPLRSVLVKRDS